MRSENPGIRKINGILLMALAGIYSTFGNVIVQFIMTNMNAPLQPVSFFLVRSIYTAAVSVLFLSAAKINPFPKKNRLLYCWSFRHWHVHAVYYLFSSHLIKFLLATSQ